jgi:hypothetical protein
LLAAKETGDAHERVKDPLPSVPIASTGR